MRLQKRKENGAPEMFTVIKKKNAEGSVAIEKVQSYVEVRRRKVLQ